MKLVRLALLQLSPAPKSIEPSWGLSDGVVDVRVTRVDIKDSPDANFIAKAFVTLGTALVEDGAIAVPVEPRRLAEAASSAQATFSQSSPGAAGASLAGRHLSH